MTPCEKSPYPSIKRLIFLVPAASAIAYASPTFNKAFHRIEFTKVRSTCFLQKSLLSS